MGSPERAYPTIHIAGTNGKSSTAAMIDGLLSAYGVRTGRFTSPHLETLRERIRLDGELIDPGRLLAAWEDVAPILVVVEADGGRPLTYFEVITLLAFAAFADTPVSVAVLEVGLGGSWDATNVVNASVGLVMPIGMDHMEWLGDDIVAIAEAKAGIIKPGMVVVAAEQQPEVAEVLSQRASEVGATLLREGVDFGLVNRQVAVGGQVLSVQGIGGTYEDILLPLHGEHMAHNAASALVAVEAFLGGGAGALDGDVVSRGFLSVSVPGRLEVIRRSPTVLLDVAHNRQGAEALAHALAEAFSFQRLVGVVGVLGDKDAAGILGALEPVLDEVVITQSSSPRAVEAEELASLAADVFGSERVTAQPSLPDAIEAAVTAAETAGELEGVGVLITGSVTVAGEARSLLRSRR
jgi:dihydrofolate synthase/folylpolyglutamate synthase